MLVSATRTLFAAALQLLLVASLAHASTQNAPKKAKEARPPRFHAVSLGGVRKMPYSLPGDPAGAHPGETELPVRPLVVDTRVKDWTTGEAHDVTDRSFAVRRALRINDALPTDKADHWVWQRGPWLLVDRATGHTTALKLPDYDPSVSEVVWFRDYAAYCGLSRSGKQLYGVVAQVAARKPMLAKKLGAWDSAAPHPAAACAPALWQREPFRITFQPAGMQPMPFDLLGSSTLLVEADDDESSPPATQ